LSLLRLKRSVEILFGVTLAVAMLAVLPGVAEAQDAAAVKGDSTRIVVSSGDSLWSISSERLGADATLRQIDRKVERIYALNRDRIGADPNLILPGQVLVVAPAEGKQAASGQRAADDRSGKPVASEQPASKKGEAVAALKPAPEKAAQKGVEIQLTPSRNSGVSGTATLTDVEGGVKVELNMKGLPKAGVEHINHVHGGGTCADDRAGRTAPVTIPLKTVVAKGNGTGSATTTLKDVTLDKLFGSDQARFILLHAKTKEGQGVPPGISCADLVPRTGSGAFETLPASGAASGGFSLPNIPAKQAVPMVSLLSATDAPLRVESLGRTAHSLLSSATSAIVKLFPQDDYLAGRRLVGLAIIALTLLVAALMAWKMPLKRNVEGPEVWGIPTGIPTGYPTAYTGYYARYDAQPSEVTDRYEYLPGGAPVSPVVEADSGGFGGEGAAAVGNGRNGAEMIAAIAHSRKRSLRGQARSSRRLPRRVVVAGAHNPRVSRHVRDAGLRDAGLRDAGLRQAARPRIRPRIRLRHSSAKGGRL
jgi:hypothetical protein